MKGIIIAGLFGMLAAAVGGISHAITTKILDEWDVNIESINVDYTDMFGNSLVTIGPPFDHGGDVDLKGYDIRPHVLEGNDIIVGGSGDDVIGNDGKFMIIWNIETTTTLVMVTILLAMMPRLSASYRHMIFNERKST